MARIPYGDCTSAAVAAHFESPRLLELTATVAAYNNDAQWQRFCAVAGLQDWVEHPDFATNALRGPAMPKTHPRIPGPRPNRSLRARCLRARLPENGV